MRNAVQPQLQPQPQQQLSESIKRTQQLMQQFQQMNNPQAGIANLLKQNPQLGFLSTLLRQGQSLEGIAKQMAQFNNLDINDVIQQLQNIPNI